MKKSDCFIFFLGVLMLLCAVSLAGYAIIYHFNKVDTVTEQTIVLDYESNYYEMHCNAVADILATEGTNKIAKRKIETYLKITGAKTQ